MIVYIAYIFVPIPIKQNMQHISYLFWGQRIQGEMCIIEKYNQPYDSAHTLNG